MGFKSFLDMESLNLMTQWGENKLCSVSLQFRRMLYTPVVTYPENASKCMLSLDTTRRLFTSKLLLTWLDGFEIDTWLLGDALANRHFGTLFTF